MRARTANLLRAGWLVAAVVALSPLSPLPLVLVPFALTLLAFRLRDPGSALLGVLALAAAMAAGAGAADTAWMAPRAWALLLGGAFVAVTALRPGGSLLGRSLAATAAALGLVLAAGLADAGLLRGLDWWMAGEIRRAGDTAQAVLARLASGDLQAEMRAAVYDWMAFQQAVYPAFLGLASVAALGAGWFAVRRLGGAEGGLPPVREFRFADGLVWLLVAGLVLMVAPAGPAAFRIGENAALFMGILYLLRGVAILIWVVAAVATSAWIAALWAVVAVLVYPVAVGAALVLGLSDTWLDLRTRLARARIRRGE